MEIAKLSDENRKALLLEMHEIVADVVSADMDKMKFCKRKPFVFTYPLKEKISDSEREIVMNIMKIPGAEEILKKVLTYTAGSTIFHLLNILDGMSDPRTEFGNWTGVALADSDQISEDPLVLHECFLETYNDWKKGRKPEYPGSL